MTKNQENRLSMFITVEQVTDFYSTEWSNFTAFRDQYAEFKTIIQTINQTVVDQRRKITGVTKDKEVAKNNAVRKGLFISGAVCAYASVTGNNKMADRVSFGLHELSKGRDTELLADLRVILEVAQQNIAQLGDYDLTQDEIDEFAGYIDAYATVLENPRQAITNRSKATKKLKAQISAADTILKNRLDKLINRLKEKSPDFWMQYNDARKIINLGHRRKKDAGENPETNNVQIALA